MNQTSILNNLLFIKIILLICLITGFSIAQTRSKITGTVKDAETGEDMYGKM